MSKTPFDCLAQLRKASIFKKCPTLSEFDDMIDSIKELVKFYDDELEFLESHFTTILSVPIKEIIITLFKWDMNMLKLLSQNKILSHQYEFVWKLLSCICSYKDISHSLPPLTSIQCDMILNEAIRQISLLCSSATYDINIQSYIRTLFNSLCITMKIDTHIMVTIPSHTYKTYNITHVYPIDICSKHILSLLSLLNTHTMDINNLSEMASTMSVLLPMNLLFILLSSCMQEINDKSTMTTTIQSYCSIYQQSYILLSKSYLYCNNDILTKDNNKQISLKLYERFISIFEEFTKYCLFTSPVAVLLPIKSITSPVFQKYYKDMNLSSKFKRLNNIEDKETIINQEDSSVPVEQDAKMEEPENEDAPLSNSHEDQDLNTETKELQTLSSTITISPQSVLSPFYTLLYSLLSERDTLPYQYPCLQQILTASFVMSDYILPSSHIPLDVLPLSPSTILFMEMTNIITDLLVKAKNRNIKYYLYSCILSLFTSYTTNAPENPSVDPIFNHFLSDILTMILSALDTNDDYFIYATSLQIIKSIFILDISLLSPCLSSILHFLCIPPQYKQVKEDQYIPLLPTETNLQLPLPSMSITIIESIMQFILEKYNTMRSLPQLFSTFLSGLETYTDISYDTLCSYLLTSLLSDALMRQFLTLLPGQIPTLWDILTKYIFGESTLCRYVAIYLFKSFESGLCINHTLSVNLKQKLIFTKKSLGTVVYSLLQSKSYSQFDLISYISFALSLLYLQDKIELYVPAISPCIVPAIPFFTQIFNDKYSDSNNVIFYVDKEEKQIKTEQFEIVLKELLKTPKGDTIYIALYLERLQYLRKVYNRIENQGHESLQNIYIELQGICSLINNYLLKTHCISPSLISLLYSSLSIFITYIPQSDLSSLLSHIIQPCEHIQKNELCGNLSLLSSSCLYEIPSITELFGSIFIKNYSSSVKKYIKHPSEATFSPVQHYIALFKAIPAGYWSKETLNKFLDECSPLFVASSLTISQSTILNNLLFSFSERYPAVIHEYNYKLIQNKDKITNIFLSYLNSQALSNIAIYHADMLIHYKESQPSSVDICMNYYLSNMSDIYNIKKADNKQLKKENISSYIYSFCRELLYISTSSSSPAVISNSSSTSMSLNDVHLPILISAFKSLIEVTAIPRTSSVFFLYITCLISLPLPTLYEYCHFYDATTYEALKQAKISNHIDEILRSIGSSSHDLSDCISEMANQTIDIDTCDLFIHFFYLYPFLLDTFSDKLSRQLYTKYIDIYTFVKQNKEIKRNDSPFCIYNEYIHGFTFFINHIKTEQFKLFIEVLIQQFNNKPDCISLFSTFLSLVPASSKHVIASAIETIMHMILINYTMSYQEESIDLLSLLLREYAFAIKSNSLSVIYTYIYEIIQNNDQNSESKLLPYSLISSILSLISASLSISPLYTSHSMHVPITILSRLITTLIQTSPSQEEQKTYDICIYKIKLITETLQPNKKQYRHYMIYLLYELFSITLSNNIVTIPHAFTPIIFDLFDLLTRNEFQQLYIQLNPASQDIYKKYYNQYKSSHQYRGQV